MCEYNLVVASLVMNMSDKTGSHMYVLCTPVYLSLNPSIADPGDIGIEFVWEIYYLIRKIRRSVSKAIPNLLFFFCGSTLW
jgi:hypothetical protein